MYRAPNIEPDFGLLYGGEQVSVLAEVGIWYRVAYDTSSGLKLGYIPKSKITEFTEIQVYMSLDQNYQSLIQWVRYHDGGYYTEAPCDPFLAYYTTGDASNLTGGFAYYCYDDGVQSAKPEIEITYDLRGHRNGEVVKCAVTRLNNSTRPITNVSATLLEGKAHLNVGELATLLGLRFCGDRILPNASAVEAYRNRRIQEMNLGWIDLLKFLKVRTTCSFRGTINLRMSGPVYSTRPYGMGWLTIITGSRAH